MIVLMIFNLSKRKMKEEKSEKKSSFI